MEKISQNLVTKIRSLGRRKSYKYRDIQTLLEIDGYKKPSLGFIFKILSSKKKRFKKIM